MPGNPVCWRPRGTPQGHGEFWVGGTPGKSRLVGSLVGAGLGTGLGLLHWGASTVGRTLGY